MERAEQIKTQTSSKTPSDNKTKPSTSQSKKQKNSDSELLEEQIEGSIMKEKPTVEWSEVVGMDAPKQVVEEALILPKKYPQLFTGERKPIKTILLYGYVPVIYIML